ncbi:MAG TPA: MFS transporter [Candidatus Paceibacterota bacterium]|nr:MFS transporter [Candidatus Paceibacterota bacterium]
MAAAKTASRSPWFWIPTLYLAEGMPNALVASVSVVFYKNLGVSNGDIAFYTGWLYLPWVIKPLWSPVVDILKTRRQWIWAMQFFLGAGFAAVALTIPAPHFFQLTLAFFWLLSFSSATHDIAADGFYMLATTEREQSFFVGVRTLFYRVATILAQGQLVILTGKIYNRTGSYASAWSWAFALVAGIFLCLGFYHWFILPRPATDQPKGAASPENFLAEFLKTFGTFFQKPKIIVMLSFILLYRLGEAQLLKMAQPFLLDPRDQGGLGLANAQLGLVYGTVGVVIFIFGAVLGGFAVARHGLKFWLWPMLLAIHLPDAVFIWLAYSQPKNLFAIGAGVAVEQFGYGFGFTAFILYMIRIARGGHQTAHYAICTGFMALGIMLPGMWSGWLQERLGYPHFFVWVILATIPSFIVARMIPLDSNFGKKNAPE